MQPRTQSWVTHLENFRFLIEHGLLDFGWLALSNLLQSTQV